MNRADVASDRANPNPSRASNVSSPPSAANPRANRRNRCAEPSITSRTRGTNTGSR